MGIAEDEEREDTFFVPPDLAFEYLSRRFTELDERARALERRTALGEEAGTTRESRETRRQQDRVAGALLWYWLGVQLNSVVTLLTQERPDGG